jgi:ribosome-binding factor A
MNENRNDRMQEVVREVAAEFLAREANRNTLITVTRTLISSDGKRVEIFITVMPESYEEQALAFANRNRSELSDFFKKKVKALPPRVEFVIDHGDKNRRRLDELSN